MKILLLGDEYSAGAMHYVPKIAKSDSCEITAGSLVLDDCSLKNHFEAIKDDLPVYKFEFNAKSSARLDTYENCSASRVFEWFEWDYIVLQQKTELSGLSDTFFPYLTDIAALVREACPSASLLLYENWAFSDRCGDESFEKYNRSTAVMADMIRNAYIGAAQETGINIILPVGEAWSEARRMYPSLELTSDGRFGSRLGEYLASAVWYELLTGNSMLKNTYRLPFVQHDKTQLLREVAHLTAEKYSIRK